MPIFVRGKGISVYEAIHEIHNLFPLRLPQPLSYNLSLVVQLKKKEGFLANSSSRETSKCRILKEKVEQ